VERVPLSNIYTRIAATGYSDLTNVLTPPSLGNQEGDLLTLAENVVTVISSMPCISPPPPSFALWL